MPPDEPGGVALVTGVTGHDGHYLSGLLLEHGYHAKDLEASNAVLYNNESPRRPEQFVTRKIAKAVAAIAEFVASAFAAADVPEVPRRNRSGPDASGRPDRHRRWRGQGGRNPRLATHHVIRRSRERYG